MKTGWLLMLESGQVDVNRQGTTALYTSIITET